MFWRKQRAAIDAFHPLHQSLIWHRGLAASLPAADWSALVASLAGHGAVVTRAAWAPPARTATILVPLLRVLAEDMKPGGVLSVNADFRGPKAQGKLWPERQIPWPPDPRVRKVFEQWAYDPWLRMHAVLRDGSVLELSVADRIRYRRFHKYNQRRTKLKRKTKTKVVQVVSVTRRLPAGAAPRRPPTPPPRWIRVKLREGRRTLIRVSAKLPPAPHESMLMEQILHIATEPFRWTPPDAARPLRRSS